ncbi:hypothetical protein HDU97_004063 [Phlyctochytrium planicorne]|nr:hypothetical protein HDU97_004063 [Phlyctochytrium planicorne]
MMDSYFTLKTNGDGFGETAAKEVFVSDVRKKSLNPSWQLLPDSIGSSKVPFDTGSYSLTLWGKKSAESSQNTGEHNDFQILEEWRVDLSSLEFVGHDLADHGRSFPSNTLLFQFLDGYYMQTTGFEAEDPEETLPVKVDSQKVKRSCKLECITRIVAAQKELLLMQNSIDALQESSESLTIRKSRIADKKADIQGRIAFIEREIMSRTQSIQSCRIRLKEMKETLAIRNRQLRESGVDRETTRHVLDSRQAELGRTKYELNLKVSPGNVMSIRGIKLPNSEFPGSDDERISTGLGYAAHLVIMIATYLEVPLRYPINPMSSRSMILDRVSRQFPGSREFPLFLKGVDKLRFEYGVFLLNKDIEQLMNHVSMNVTNLRNTLPNLKALIDSVGIDEESMDDDMEAESTNNTILPPLSLSKSEGNKSAPAHFSISSNHGPDSNSAFTQEGPLRLIKHLPRNSKVGDEDGEYLDSATTPSHLDEYVPVKRREPDVEKAPALVFPGTVSSGSALRPEDFWPDAD